MHAQSLSHIRLCDLMDCSLPGSSVCGIFRARILEWAASSYFRGSSLPRGWTRISVTDRRALHRWATVVCIRQSQFPSLLAPQCFPFGNFEICESVSVLQVSSFVSFLLDSTCKWYPVMFFFVWLISLRRIICRSRVAANALILLRLNDIHCVNAPRL